MDNSRPMLRTPPHSIEAEQAVIASVTNNNRILTEIDWLLESDFYASAHVVIWRRIQVMAMQNLPIDPVLLITALEQAGEIDTAGGAEHLIEILTSDTGSANTRHYAQIIRDRSISREMIRIAYEIADIGFSGDPIQSKIDAAQSLTARLETKSLDEPKHVNDVLRRTIEGIDERFRNEGNIVGLETGFADLDRATNGLSNGSLIIVAGRPSMGKTTLALNIAENVALAGKFVIFISLEMPDEDLMIKSLSSIGGASLNNLRSKPQDEDWAKLTAAASRLKDTNFYIDDQSVMTSAQVLSRCRRIAAKQRKAPALVVVDYMQLLNDEGEETVRMTRISRNMKLAAGALGCPVIALSQINRGVESRPLHQRRPQMSDLRQSGAIEQDADLIIMVYRDEVYNDDTNQKGIAEAIIRKQRNGPLKTIYLASQLERSRFKTLENHTPPSDSTPKNGRRYEGYDD